jgi:hypothetical protein
MTGDPLLNFQHDSLTVPAPGRQLQIQNPHANIFRLS